MAMAASEAARALHALGFKTLPVKPGTKVPATAHGVNDATADDAATDAWYSVRPGDGLAVCGEGFVIFDLDAHGGAANGIDTLLDWEMEHGALPDTLRQTTPSGGEHVFYRVHEEIRPSVNPEVAVDVRAWGSYVVCEPSAGYCFDRDLEPGCVAEADGRVMEFLAHVRPKGRDSRRGRPPKQDAVMEGGRNDYLFRLGASLKSASQDADVIAASIEAHNRVKCKPPLDGWEVRRIIESVLALPDGHSDEVKEQESRQRGRPRKFSHNGVARELIDSHGACMLDGETPAVRDASGRYRLGWDAVDAEIIKMHDDCTESNRREVKAYLRTMAPTRRQSPADLMAFKNGVLDLRTMELRGWRDDDIIPNVIPHDWNPDARSDLLYRTLEKMACGELSTMMNLMEFMGLCMARSAKRYPHFPVFVGEGSNGKSTYIALLHALLGSENVSALQPKEITSRFMGSHIVGKTANLGDDISSGYLDADDCAVIKKIATGDLMFTDVKGTKGFHFEPYCTMVFSCNQFPRIADTTPGFMRRLFPVEFNAVFSRSDPDFDPLITERLMSEEVLEYACVVAVEGLKRYISQNGPTPNPLSEALKREVVTEGNTAMQWVSDEGVTAEHIIGMTKAELHAEYMSWAERNGYARTAMASGTLAAQIGTYFRLACHKTGHRDVSGSRKSVKVFDYKNR